MPACTSSKGGGWSCAMLFPPATWHIPRPSSQNPDLEGHDQAPGLTLQGLISRWTSWIIHDNSQLLRQCNWHPFATHRDH